MSAEAAKLFQTLQESPLPLEKINISVSGESSTSIKRNISPTLALEASNCSNLKSSETGSNCRKLCNEKYASSLKSTKFVTTQCSTSTDEGCETEQTNEKKDFLNSTSDITQRLQSYASSSSSSGVIASYSKSLNQNLSLHSANSHCSILEGMGLNMGVNIDSASSLPSSASSITLATASDRVSDCSFYNSNNSCFHPSNNFSMLHARSPAQSIYKKTPIHLREVRRESDGLVAQGLVNSMPIFNSGEDYDSYFYDIKDSWSDLQKLQKEVVSLKSEDHGNMARLEEDSTYPFQNSQFHAILNRLSLDLPHTSRGGHLTRPNQSFESVDMPNNLFNNVRFYGSSLPMTTATAQGNIALICDMNSLALQRQPLQQQLLQHRLLQQKRQLLQKQYALDTNFLRQQYLMRESFNLGPPQEVVGQGFLGTSFESMKSCPLNDVFIKDFKAFERSTRKLQHTSIIALPYDPAINIKSSYLKSRVPNLPMLSMQRKHISRLSKHAFETWRSHPIAVNSSKLTANIENGGYIAPQSRANTSAHTSNWQTVRRPLNENPILEISEHLESAY